MLIVVVHAAVVVLKAIRPGLPTTEEPAVPSQLVEPAGLIPTAEEAGIAEHERLVGAGAGRSEAEEQ